MEQWQIELRDSVRTLEQLEKYYQIKNRKILSEVIGNMRFSITPHTLRLIDFGDPNDPIFLMSVPQEKELLFLKGELLDPIGDDAYSPIPFLVHRYVDRVLIHTTFFCSGNCRFCFRRSKTGRAHAGPTVSDTDRICVYLKEHTEIEEVILSGGDPLTLTDEQIDDWLSRLRSIDSITRIRIHTRTLVNLPSRVTDKLVDLFKRYSDNTHPIIIVTHFNHPNEIAHENIQSVSKLVNAGFVIRNQSVLLKGVNDNADILAVLLKRLVDIRIVPYYIHQLDFARGTNHFRVSLKRGINIMRELQENISGIAMPRYMLDIPGGKGKIPISHQYTVQENGDWKIKCPSGEIVDYCEPDEV